MGLGVKLPLHPPVPSMVGDRRLGMGQGRNGNFIWEGERSWLEKLEGWNENKTSSLGQKGGGQKGNRVSIRL